MYKRILLPTDGSVLSAKAVASGILLAQECGASVVGVHVIPAPHEDRLEAWMHHDPQFAQRRQALFEKFADQYLALIAERAQAAQVPCVCKKIRANDPYLALLETAQQEHCDLVYMASHGWKGDAARMLGSVTLKVLLHSKVPVLVHRGAGAVPPSG